MKAPSVAEIRDNIRSEMEYEYGCRTDASEWTYHSCPVAGIKFVVGDVTYSIEVTCSSRSTEGEAF